MSKTAIAGICAMMLLCASTVSAKTGVYISGGLGVSSQWGMPDQSELAPEGATQEDDENFTGRLSLGYNYDFNPLLGIAPELGWGHYSDTNYGAGTLVSSAWDLMLVSTYSPSSTYSFIAKAGIARETLEIPDVFSPALGNDHVEYNPIAGFGLGLNLTESTQLHLDYLHLFGEDVTLDTESSATPSIDAVTIGLKRTFG